MLWEPNTVCIYCIGSNRTPPLRLASTSVDSGMNLKKNVLNLFLQKDYGPRKLGPQRLASHKDGPERWNRGKKWGEGRSLTSSQLTPTPSQLIPHLLSSSLTPSHPIPHTFPDHPSYPSIPSHAPPSSSLTPCQPIPHIFPDRLGIMSF